MIIMNIYVEIQEKKIEEIVKNYIGVYRSMVLKPNHDFLDATLYITDSVKSYHKHNNTIVIGFEILGFQNVVNVEDATIFFQKLHQLVSQIINLDELVEVCEGKMIRVDSIISVESFNRKSVVKTLKSEFNTDFNFKQWSERLRYRNFLEVHRGIMVNIEAIDGLKDDVVYLKNATTMPVSRRKRNLLKSLLMGKELKIQD